jgi:protein involved in polysaccharide export with SLBB domain
LTGCVSHRSIESQYEKISAELEPGDRVEVELKDGQELSFRVTEIRETEIIGDTSTDITRGELVTVQYSDIKRLERVDQRPLVLIGGVVAVPFLLLFIFVAFFASAGPA